MKKTNLAVALVAGALLFGAAGWGTIHLRALEGKPAKAQPGAAAAAESAIRDKDIAFFEKRAAEDTQSAGDRAELAGRYLQRSRETGNFNDVYRAEKLARESLALRGVRNSATNTTLIGALLEQHRFAEARDLAQQLVAEEPTIDRYRSMLGEIDLEVGDYDGARSAFESLSGRSRGSLSIAPSYARWLEITGNTPAARLMLYRALGMADSLKEMPREPLAWYHMRVADLEMRNGRLNNAANQLRIGRDILPFDHRLLSADARLAALRHEWRRVIALGDSAIATVLDPGTIGLVGDAYAALGDTAKAAEYNRTMEVAVVQQPGAYHRAWSLFLLDHDRRIPEVLAKVQEELKTRRDIYGYDLFGWALYKQHRYPEAQAALAKARSLGTEDAVLFYHAGMIELATGNTSGARQLLEHALELNPIFDPSHPAIAKATLDSIGRK